MQASVVYERAITDAEGGVFQHQGPLAHDFRRRSLHSASAQGCQLGRNPHGVIICELESRTDIEGRDWSQGSFKKLFKSEAVPFQGVHGRSESTKSLYCTGSHTCDKAYTVDHCVDLQSREDHGPGPIRIMFWPASNS